jgi:hypothetical protein
MNALHALPYPSSVVDDDDDSYDLRIANKVAEIDADLGVVAELFHDDEIGDIRRGKGTLQLFTVRVAAMNVWPVIEKLCAELPLDDKDREHIRELYREVRPFLPERPVLVQLAAEAAVQERRMRA